MAQNITFLGASYSNVPAVTLPKTGGGTASFTDVTDTTAVAAQVAEGAYFYTAAGVKTEGTAAAGGLIIIHDEPDGNGGTIRHITGEDYGVLEETDSHGGTITHLTAGTVISGVKTITTNGTHDVAMYADAYVNVEGVVLPKFSASINSSYVLTSMTCDKTYSQCAAIMSDGVICANVEVTWPDSSKIECGAVGLYDSAMGTLVYVALDPESNEPWFEFTYQSDGSIDVYAPPRFIQQLSTTTNGYWEGLYNEITVDVPTGTARSSSDLTASGATVTVPAGLYSTQASKSVASGSATTPATSITANPSISVNSSGLITATASATKSVTPTVSAGYVSSGTAGTITVSGSNTSQLSTQAGTTIAPTESEQTVVASGKYTTGAVKVGAISSTYVGSGIDRNDSTDLTRSGATVSVPAGYYAEAASMEVAAGTVNTPSATKGTVSNHSVTVTPSVNVYPGGYITSGVRNGTAVTVTASELASGNKEITDNGTNIDVVGYSTVSVDVASSNVYTATISGNGNSTYCYVKKNNAGSKYYTDGDTITFEDGDYLYFYLIGSSG